MDNLNMHKLFIDKNGQWYVDGALMISEKIVNLFASHLEKDSQDKYHIEWQNYKYPVEVEDAPFFVQSISKQPDQLMIQLYDGRRLPFPSGSIIMKNNIPYISLFSQCDTKLSLSSYCELCDNVIEQDGHYFIKYGDNQWRFEEIGC